MLESVKINRRQSEIRQALSELVGKQNPTEDETRSMESMDAEYRQNETRYRAALIAEDAERREAGEELETRGDKEWNDLIDRFEMRQVALALDEGAALSGPTNEIVQEMRSKGGYRGMPIPWEALETRAGETIASGTPNPVRTAPIIDRLFSQSVAARMGGQMVNIDAGEAEFPVTSSSVSAGWASSETGNVPGPSAYTTVDRPLKPDHTLGLQMRLTRKTLKQSGNALEQAVRRDMNGAISEALDKAVFLGSGSSGEPLGLIPGASTYGITETAIDDTASYGAFRSAIVRFLIASAANSPGDVRVMVRPEVWNTLDALAASDAAPMWEWDRLIKAVMSGGVTMTANALAAPSGDPAETKAILTTTVNGVAPFFVGTWGAIDLIRDPYSDAQSGGLRLTALATMDITVSRSVQTEILTGIQ